MSTSDQLTKGNKTGTCTQFNDPALASFSFGYPGSEHTSGIVLDAVIDEHLLIYERIDTYFSNNARSEPSY